MYYCVNKASFLVRVHATDKRWLFSPLPISQMYHSNFLSPVFLILFRSSTWAFPARSGDVGALSEGRSLVFEDMTNTVIIAVKTVLQTFTMTVFAKYSFPWYYAFSGSHKLGFDIPVHGYLSAWSPDSQLKEEEGNIFKSCHPQYITRSRYATIFIIKNH